MLVWIALLSALSVLMIAAWYDSLTAKKVSKLQERLGYRLDPIVEAISAPRKRFSNPFLTIGRHLASAEAREEISNKLKQAGNPQGLTVEEFISLKLIASSILFGLVSLLGVLGSGWRGIGLGLMAGGIGYLLPTFWLDSRVAERKTGVETGLLNFVNMLTVATEAGLSIQEALARVGERHAGTLGEEIRRILAEVDMGKIRSIALREAAERYDSADLALVFGTIAQADEYGTPMAEVLRSIAKQLQQARRNRAQEMSQKASVKILIPIILFMFVPLAILMVGPALLNLMQSLG